MRLQVASNEGLEDATCTRIGIITAKACAPSQRLQTSLLTLSQKVCRRAVDRNLMRRRMRHVYRTHKELWPSRVDIVVVMGPTGMSQAAQVSHCIC